MSKETPRVPRKVTARRKILKGVVAGGGTLTASQALPERWTRPIVETVALPAHAQTTTPQDAGPSQIETLSPFQSGEEPIAANLDDGRAQQFAAIDQPDASANWDTLSDSEILEFFVNPARAGATLNVASSYQMFAQANGDTGHLCIAGEFVDHGIFSATLFNTPVVGETIKGGIATAVGVDELVFSDFQLVGGSLNGSFDITVNNATSVTDVSVVLTPGGSGCVM